MALVEVLLKAIQKALYNMGTSGEFRRLLADLIDFFQIIFSRVSESATRGNITFVKFSHKLKALLNRQQWLQQLLQQLVSVYLNFTGDVDQLF